MPSVFQKYEAEVYKNRYEGRIKVHALAGGIPSDPKKAEAWLKTKLMDKDDVIRQKVAETMIDRAVDVDEATETEVIRSHLNGFKRDDTGLFIEGRQLKAAIREAANVRWPKRSGWGGIPRKGTRSFFAEHVFVVEDKLHLKHGDDFVTEPTGVVQRFVHTWRGNGIQYEEYVEDAEFDFTVITDNDFTAEEWGLLWVTGQQQGVGATRSQGFGRYEVTRWDQVK